MPRYVTAPSLYYGPVMFPIRYPLCDYGRLLAGCCFVSIS